MAKLKDNLKGKMALAATAGALATALALYLVGILLLPALVKNTVRAMAITALGSQDVRIGSASVGLFGTEIERISFEGSLPLKIERFEIKYNPFSILRWRIEKAKLTGLKINLSERSGQLYLNGKPLETKASNGMPTVGEVLAGIGNLPFSIGTMELNNCEIKVNTETFALSMPGRGYIKPVDRNWSAADVSIDILPNGQHIKILMKAFQANSRLEAKLYTPDEMQLAALPLARLLNAPEKTSLAGVLKFNSSIVIEGTHLNSFSLTSRLEKLQFLSSILSVANSAGQEEAVFTVKLDDAKGIFSLSGLSLGVDASKTELKRLSGSFKIAKDTLKGSSEMELENAEGTSPLKDKALLKEEFSLAFDGSVWRKITARIFTQETLQGEFKGAKFSLREPNLLFEASNQGKAPAFSVEARTPEINAESKGAKLQLKDARLQAKGASPDNFTLAASLANAYAQAGEISCKVSNGTATVERSQGGFSGAVACGTASLHDAAQDADLEGITLKLPFNFSKDKARTADGDFSIRSIEWNGRRLATLSSRISLDREKLSVAGQIAASELKGAVLNFAGEGRLKEGLPVSEIKFSMPPFKAGELDLGKFTPKARGILAKGELSIDGSFSTDYLTPKGQVAVVVRNATLRDAKGVYSIDGIDATLKMSKLPELRSEPSQRIHFKYASYGELEISNGDIAFRVDSANSLFIEAFKASFCGGTIRTQAFALNPHSDEYNILLVCDRVSITRFLGQAGFGQAEGKGAINGSIPLEIKQGRISFSDAFLYSTPGEPGIIRIDDRGMLSVGMAQREDEPDFVGLAREALKNYSYNWAKIAINTRGQNLEISLHLDGKPVEPMPFRKEGELFLRDSSCKLIFQGIRMDLNFNLPLYQVLGLKEDLKTIIEKGDSKQ